MESRLEFLANASKSREDNINFPICLRKAPLPSRHIVAPHIRYCCCLVAKLCPTHCNPMDCSPPAFSVHGISQARILEQVAISFSRRSSQPRDRTRVLCIGKQIIYNRATREALTYYMTQLIRKHISRTLGGDFPGDPVAKTWRSQYKGPRFNPRSGN